MPRTEPAIPAARTVRARKCPAPANTTAPVQGRGDAGLARTHTAQALATLVAIMTNADAPATARVSAANAVLDRAWGKPRQDLELSSTFDAVAAIQRARQRVHRQAGDAAAAGGGDGDMQCNDRARP
jgi:hypothetical protein